MLLVNTVPVTVLFNAGATHSFVNPRAAARMDCKFENLEVPLGVTTLIGSIYQVEQIARSCTIIIGSFEILQRVGPVAYRLALPPTIQGIHDVFHVFQLRRYILDPQHVILFEPLQLKENLTYVEEPDRIIDRKDRVLRNRAFPFVKVLWRHHQAADATWEPESEMRQKYPHLFGPST